ISATGNAKVAPDMATLTLSVVREAETAREALDANTTAMAAVLNAFRDEGIEERDLQTSGFNIQPRYFYPKRSSDGQQAAPRIVAYSVTNGLTVRVRDLAKVGAILDRSVTLGVNSSGSIAFGSSDPSPFIQEARKKAMQQAILKAKTLTSEAGVKLGRILSIREPNPRRRRAVGIARMASSRAESSAVPIAAGENSYSVTVTVRWELQQ
ncbi:MAG: SIMPL domain-containing protein, partial [Pseudomonadota bacterium]